MNLSQHDLILLDFDGLLVDTEPLHYKAYCLMFNSFGLHLPWSISEFCQIAHQRAEIFIKTIRSMFPELKSHDWNELYAIKKRFYLNFIQQEPLGLMPEADQFLKTISHIPHAVVTHSPLEQIEIIRSKIPELQSIPHWFTREDYQNPKPAPDGYLHALNQLGGKNSIGFEDSIRGYESLQAAHIPAVLVRPEYYPPIDLPSHRSLGELIS